MADMKSNREHLYPHERLVEGLDSQQILHALQFDVWKTPNHSITSAEKEAKYRFTGLGSLQSILRTQFTSSEGRHGS